MPLLYICCDRKSGDESPHSKQDGGVKPPLQECLRVRIAAGAKLFPA